MAVNSWMHPRNVFKNTRPDFKALALKYEKFREAAKLDLSGKVSLNFKSTKCLQALSWALLKEHFDLDVEMPLNRLIPTIPLRLNYILWIEDILEDAGKDHHVNGIDIGTGASCIYALLGCKKNGWRFVATESDKQNLETAMRNVQTNNMSELIKIVEVGFSTIFDPFLQEQDGAGAGAAAGFTYDFSMCNPPFFKDNEAWGSRRVPHGANSASSEERSCPGGEVYFARRTILESVKLKDKIRIFTTMLGQKSSMAPVKEELRKQGIKNVGFTEFCQGRTTRWGVGWSFDPSVVFPISLKQQMKAKKKKPKPLMFDIPRVMKLHPDLDYSLRSISTVVLSYLTELKVIYEFECSSPTKISLELAAVENTWSSQRRQRRKMERQLRLQKKHAEKLLQSSTQEAPSPADANKECAGTSDEHMESDTSMEVSPTKPQEVIQSLTTANTSIDRKRNLCHDSGLFLQETNVDGKRSCTEEGMSETQSCSGESSTCRDSKIEGIDMLCPDDINDDTCILRCRLTLALSEADEDKMKRYNNKQDEDVDMSYEDCEREADTDAKKEETIKLKFTWIDGKDNNLMLQLMQYFLNHFK